MAFVQDIGCIRLCSFSNAYNIIVFCNEVIRGKINRDKVCVNFIRKEACCVGVVVQRLYQLWSQVVGMKTAMEYFVVIGWIKTDGKSAYFNEAIRELNCAGKVECFVGFIVRVTQTLSGKRDGQFAIVLFDNKRDAVAGDAFDAGYLRDVWLVVALCA